MLDQPDYTQGLQQGLDRISSLLQERSAPRTSDFGLQSQSMGIAPNVSESLLIDAIASNIASGGRGGKSYNQYAQDYIQNQRKAQMEDANAMLNVLKQQADIGELRSKSVYDKIRLITGDDVQGQAMFLDALANDPEEIDPMNSTQVLSKLAAIQRRTGYESPALQLEKSKNMLEFAKAQSDIDYRKAMIEQSKQKTPNTVHFLSKPIPATALKMQNEALDAVGTARNIQADLGSIINAIDSGKLNLGLISNIVSSGRNYLGLSTEESRNYQVFLNTLEKLRNDSLRLNKGVQTEGDSQRAWNEILTNINDPELVKQRLKEVQQINDRAANLKMMEVDQIRQNYGAPPMDYSGYNTAPAILTNNEPMDELPDPMEHSGRTITDTDTGQKYKSNGSEWIPQ